MCSPLTEGPTKTQDRKAFKIVAVELEIYKHSITCQVDKPWQIHAELYTETLLLTMHGERCVSTGCVPRRTFFCWNGDWREAIIVWEPGLLMYEVLSSLRIYIYICIRLLLSYYSQHSSIWLYSSPHILTYWHTWGTLSKRSHLLTERPSIGSNRKLDLLLFTLHQKLTYSA